VAVSALDFKGIEYSPIGNGDRYYDKKYIVACFSGVFDGQGVIIKNLNINNSTMYNGLFGYVTGAIIKNIIMDSSCYIKGGGSTGGIVGYSDGGGKDSPYGIFNCVNYATIESSAARIGGIVGCHHNIIEDCINYGNITGNNNVGGIVGYGSGFRIESCINYGNVTGMYGDSKIGGIVGYSDAGVIKGNKSCYGIITNTCEYGPDGNAGAVIGISPKKVGNNVFSDNYYYQDVVVVIKDKVYKGQTPRGVGYAGPHDITEDNGAVLIENPQKDVGDINGDEKVDNADKNVIVHDILGNISNKYELMGLDLNNDGTVNAADLVIFLKIVIELLK
jgi:hypothetical protein